MAYKRTLTEAHKRKISEGVKRAWAKIPPTTTLAVIDGELCSPSTQNINNTSNNELNEILSDGKKNKK